MGMDDTRHLTALLDTLNRARGRFPKEPLIGQTTKWIDKIDATDGDLNTIRHEMAQRIIAMLDLGS